MAWTALAAPIISAGATYALNRFGGGGGRGKGARSPSGHTDLRTTTKRTPGKIADQDPMFQRAVAGSERDWKDIADAGRAGTAVSVQAAGPSELQQRAFDLAPGQFAQAQQTQQLGQNYLSNILGGAGGIPDPSAVPGFDEFMRGIRRPYADAEAKADRDRAMRASSAGQRYGPLEHQARAREQTRIDQMRDEAVRAAQMGLIIPQMQERAAAFGKLGLPGSVGSSAFDQLAQTGATQRNITQAGLTAADKERMANLEVFMKGIGGDERRAALLAELPGETFEHKVGVAPTAGYLGAAAPNRLQQLKTAMDMAAPLAKVDYENLFGGGGVGITPHTEQDPYNQYF